MAKLWLSGLLTAALALAPLASRGSGLHLLTLLCLYAAMAQAWNLSGGFAGRVDLGAVSFFGLGGYATALLMANLNAPLPVALASAGLASTLLAVLGGWPLSRLHGLYFAVGTLGISQALREVAQHWSPAGGAAGLSLPAGGLGNTGVYELALALVAAVTLLVWCAGPRLAKRKLLAYALAGLAIGLAGGLSAAWVSFVDPASTFNIGISVEVMVMAVLGGAGSVWGPLLGALLLTLAGEAVSAYLPSYQVAALGVIAIVVALWLPRGLLGRWQLELRLPPPLAARRARERLRESVS